MDDLRVPSVQPGLSRGSRIERDQEWTYGGHSQLVEQTEDMEILKGSRVESTAKTFGEFLDNTIKNVNRDQFQSDLAIKELVAGRTKNIHETMLAIERADISMKLMMQVRNKVLEAYREVMRMQV